MNGDASSWARRAADQSDRQDLDGLGSPAAGTYCRGMSIRDAEPDDLVALRALYRRSSPILLTERVCSPGPTYWMRPPFSVAVERTRVAVERGAVVGFATTSAREANHELVALFVDPDAMGRGVGRALLDDAIAIALAEGSADLEVTASDRSRGFYERAGFEAIGSGARGPGAEAASAHHRMTVPGQRLGASRRTA